MLSEQRILLGILRGGIIIRLMSETFFLFFNFYSKQVLQSLVDGLRLHTSRDPV